MYPKLSRKMDGCSEFVKGLKQKYDIPLKSLKHQRLLIKIEEQSVML